MPKKKQAVSGFTILMKDLQEEYARKGIKVPPLSEMKDKADPIWKNLSSAEKEIYTERAKAFKCKIRETTQKMASDGTLVEDNIQKQEEVENLVKEMVKDIQQHIGLSFHNEESFKASVIGMKMYIVCFNIACITEENECVPLEVGIVEYSIQRGIMRSYHKFINPGRIPRGYAGEAKRHSLNTHEIPFDGHESSISDYRLLWQEISHFLMNSGIHEDLPPVFCLQEDIIQTFGCMQWIMTHAGVNSNALCNIRVWDLAVLLHEIRSAVGQGMVSTYIAEDKLKGNAFDFEPDTRCIFHEEKDSRYCALGYAKRLCFHLSDCLCVLFAIQLTENHLPIRTFEAKGYEVYIPSQSNETKDFIESELPQRIASRTCERASSRGSGVSSRISEASSNYGLDTFSDDDDESHNSFVSQFKNRTPAPISDLAQMSLNSTEKASSHASMLRTFKNEPPYSNYSSVGLDTFGEEESQSESGSVHRQPRISASAFGRLQYSLPTSAPGHGIGRGRSRNE